MVNFKKFFASLGALTTIIPVVVLVSCGASVVDPRDQNDVDEVASKIDTRQKAENKEKVFPEWKIGDKVSFKDLGIKEPEDKKGTQIKYEVLAVNQDISFVEVRAIVTKNKAIPKKVVIHIENYLKVQDYWNERFKLISEAVNKKEVFTKYTNQIASELFAASGSEKASLEAMGVSQEKFFKGIDLTNIEIKHSWDFPNDSEGTMRLDFILYLTYRKEKWDPDKEVTVPGNGTKDLTINNLLIKGYKKV